MDSFRNLSSDASVNSTEFLQCSSCRNCTKIYSLAFFEELFIKFFYKCMQRILQFFQVFFHTILQQFIISVFSSRFLFCFAGFPTEIFLLKIFSVLIPSEIFFIFFLYKFNGRYHYEIKKNLEFLNGISLAIPPVLLPEVSEKKLK